MSFVSSLCIVPLGGAAAAAVACVLARPRAQAVDLEASVSAILRPAQDAGARPSFPPEPVVRLAALLFNVAFRTRVRNALWLASYLRPGESNRHVAVAVDIVKLAASDRRGLRLLRHDGLLPALVNTCPQLPHEATAAIDAVSRGGAAAMAALRAAGALQALLRVLESHGHEVFNPSAGAPSRGSAAPAAAADSSSAPRARDTAGQGAAASSLGRVWSSIQRKLLSDVIAEIIARLRDPHTATSVSLIVQLTPLSLLESGAGAAHAGEAAWGPLNLSLLAHLKARTLPFVLFLTGVAHCPRSVSLPPPSPAPPCHRRALTGADAGRVPQAAAAAVGLAGHFKGGQPLIRLVERDSFPHVPASSRRRHAT